MHRQTGAVLLALLVVFSGCSALGGGGTATPADDSTPVPAAESTPTPTATPTPSATAAQTSTGSTTSTATPTSAGPTPTAAPDLEPVSSVAAPPGLDGRRLAEPGALVQSHWEALSGATYRSNFTIENSSRGTSRVSVRNGSDSLRGTVTLPASNLRNEYYLSSDDSGVRNLSTGRIRYGNGPTSVQYEAARVVGYLGSIGPQFATAADWHAIGARTVDGQEQVVFAANRLAPSGDSSLTLVSADESASNVDGRMVVSSGGVIQRVHLEWTAERSNGSTYERAVTYSLTQVGNVSVSEPGWFADAPKLNASVADGNRLLAVDHTGGTAIEAGTTLTVGGVFGPGQNVTLDQRVAPGDTVYVYRTGSGGDAALEASVGERPTVPDEAAAFSGNVMVSGTQGEFTFEAGVRVVSGEES